MKRFVFVVIAVLLALTPVLSAGAAPVAQEEMMVYTVQSGDTLTGISKTYLGRATAYLEIVEATNTSTEPGIAMIEDPNVIITGWKIVIPTPEILPEMPVEMTDTMVVAVSGEVADWDPASAVFWIGNEILQNAYDPLVEFGMTTGPEGYPKFDTSKIEGVVAESWEVSEDGSVTTFHIRKGITFQNGDALTAQDVRDSFERYLQLPSTAQWLISDPGQIQDISQLTVIDDYTIAFDTGGPNPLLLGVLTEMNMMIMNVDQVLENATADDPWATEWAKTNVAGSGAYTVASWEPGVQVVLEAYEDYWRGSPSIKKVIYRIVPSPEDRMLLIRNGDVDVIYELPLKDIVSMRDAPGVDVISYLTHGNQYMHMMNTVPPFDNKAFREAILYAIPYKRIIEEANYGLAGPLTSPIPWQVQYALEGSWPYTSQDLEMAKQKLAEAGYPNGEGAPELTFDLKLGVPEEEATAIYIQSALAEIGLTMNLNKMNAAAHTEKGMSHESAFTMWYFIPYVPDAQYHLFWNFTTGGGTFNFSEYYNARVDEIVGELLPNTLDEPTRKALIEEAQLIISADAPQGLLYQPSWNLATRDTVKGFRIRSDSLVPWWFLSKE